MELQRPHGQDGGCRGNAWYDEEYEHLITESHSAALVDVKIVFAGELLKEMTVDYERATSEERLDEVRVCVCVTATECLRNTILTSRIMSEVNTPEGPQTKKKYSTSGAKSFISTWYHYTKHNRLHQVLQFGG